MSDLINGRTPEVIKSNLSYLVRGEICPQNHEYGCDYDKQTEECRTVIDSLAYIERLEAKLARRDALLAEMGVRIPEEEG
jgi:hypothetical protein